MNRYSRQIQLDEIGSQGQNRLAAASVLVVGAGGLGTPVLLYLVGAGVGTVGIADMDQVTLSNLHRQVLYTESQIGSAKTKAAKEGLSELNSEVKIITHDSGVLPDNALKIIQNYDLIIDGSDNFETRYLINDACVKAAKPWIYGALYKHQGQFALFNAKDGPTYRCLYPQPPKAKEVPSCNEMGIMGSVAGLIGTHMAHLALQHLLWPDNVPSEKVFYWDLNSYAFRSIELDRNAETVAALKGSSAPLTAIELESCASQVKQIDLAQALAIENAIFLDVREPSEEPRLRSQQLLELPLKNLETSLDHLDPAATYFIFCQSGQRAVRAAKTLQTKGFDSVFALNAAASELADSLNYQKKEIL